MKVGDWVIVEDCKLRGKIGKVARVLDLVYNPTSFVPNAIIWDPFEGSFEECLVNVNRAYGWSAKVRPLTLLERELYEL